MTDAYRSAFRDGAWALAIGSFLAGAVQLQRMRSAQRQRDGLAHGTRILFALGILVAVILVTFDAFGLPHTSTKYQGKHACRAALWALGGFFGVQLGAYLARPRGGYNVAERHAVSLFTIAGTLGLGAASLSFGPRA